MGDYLYRGICHTKCYWLDNLWHVGEVYEGEYPLNKHFSEDGKRAKVEPPKEAGLDKRSTKEIRKILLEKYNSEFPKEAKRKDMWRVLNNFETGQEQDFSTSEIEQHDFVASCGFTAKSQAGLVAHERQCADCKIAIGE